MYEKELELRMSRSYGPGRYDRDYEERGRDLPAGYVRWTEQRNMQAFLDLVAAGPHQRRPSSRRTASRSTRRAEAYASSPRPERGERAFGVLLEYSEEHAAPSVAPP